MCKTLRFSLANLFLQVGAFRETISRLPKWNCSTSPAYDHDRYEYIIRTTSQALSGIRAVRDSLLYTAQEKLERSRVPLPDYVQQQITPNTTPVKRTVPFVP